MMGGGGQSAGGSGANGTVFIPPNQGAAADALQGVIQPLLGLSANAGAGTPGGTNYPLAQGAVYGDILNNPYANQAIWGSDQASQNAFNIAAPQAFGGAGALNTAALGGLPYASQALTQGFDPRYSAAISGIESNPYYGQALGGAQTAANMGAQGAGAIQGLGGQLGGAVSPLLASGFDPRAALFNRTEGRLMDQTNAINAMSGVGNSPYGASVAANALGNFDIDWQNQQLARQAQGAQAAGNAANTSASLYGAAPGLAAGSAGLPSSVYTGQIGQILQALDQRNKAGIQGAAGYGSLLDNTRQGLAGATGLNLQGVQAQNTFGAAPYNTQSAVGQNALAGLTNLTGLGNQQFVLPQQEIGNLMQYMGLGQSASNISGNLGQMGFNQLSSGIGGGLSAANTLFGGSSGGLLGGLGGGAGAGAAGLGAADAATLNAAIDASGGALTAGSDVFASAAPLALSAA